MTERKGTFHGPHDTEVILLSAINGVPEGLTLNELDEIIEKEGLHFYVGDSLISFLAESWNEEYITYDVATQLFKPGTKDCFRWDPPPLPHPNF